MPERARHLVGLLRRAGDLVVDRPGAAGDELVDGDALLGDEAVGPDRPRAGGVEQLERDRAAVGAAHLEAGDGDEGALRDLELPAADGELEIVVGALGAHPADPAVGGGRRGLTAGIRGRLRRAGGEAQRERPPRGRLAAARTPQLQLDRGAARGLAQRGDGRAAEAELDGADGPLGQPDPALGDGAAAGRHLGGAAQRVAVRVGDLDGRDAGSETAEARGLILAGAASAVAGRTRRQRKARRMRRGHGVDSGAWPGWPHSG